MPSVTDYRKIILVTDPNNPDADVIEAAEKYGEVIFRLKCEDGIVLLVLEQGDETYVKADPDKIE